MTQGLDVVLNARKSVFRYESLQDYTAMDGTELVDGFLKEGCLTFHPKDTDWWQDIKKKNDAGVKTCRVRMIMMPMTDYTRWEIAWLHEVAEFSGEDVRIIKKDELPVELKDVTDFYLVDDSKLNLLVYGPKGKLLREDFVTDSRVIARYLSLKNILIKLSQPI